MTSTDDPDAELLEHESRDWLIHLVSGGATDDDRVAHETWTHQSPAHQAAFAEQVKLRQRLREAYRASQAEPSTSVLPSRSAVRRHPGLHRRAMLGGAIAASTAAYLAARPPLHLWPALSEWRAQYQTATGEQRHVTFADGVSVVMNTRTSLNGDVHTEGMQAELISGEVAVSLALDPARSFTVVADGGRASASQAKFNMRIDAVATSVCVTCLEGDVHVDLDGHHVSLQPRQQVSYTRDRMNDVLQIDPAVVTAWRSGLLVFQDTPLSQVLDQANQYRPGRIVLVNAQLGRMRVDGVFHVDGLDGVINQVRKLGAQVTYLPGGVVLLR